MAEGLVYVPEFITPAEEEALLAEVRALDLREAKYKDYTAKRRIASFGAGYDFAQNELTPAPTLPPFLAALRDRVAPLAGIDPREFGYAMVAEYRPGTQLGWHRDVPQFEAIAGISLASAARMRFRAYPPRKNAKILSLDLAPRSAYVLKDEARWQWQHSIAPTPALRYSITFRTRKKEIPR
jgi:alkylated DNA repair dioxygenase AlkB